jgi:hypothetical protein
VHVPSELRDNRDRTAEFLDQAGRVHGAAATRGCQFPVFSKPCRILMAWLWDTAPPNLVGFWRIPEASRMSAQAGNTGRSWRAGDFLVRPRADAQVVGLGRQLWVDSGHWDRATDPHLEPRADIRATLKVRRIRMRPRSSCSETGLPAEETGLRVLTSFQDRGVSVAVSYSFGSFGHPYGGQVSGHPLDPLRARRPRLKRIAKILGLAGHLPIEELHDAHGVRRPPVIG